MLTCCLFVIQIKLRLVKDVWRSPKDDCNLVCTGTCREELENKYELYIEENAMALILILVGPPCQRFGA